jgi:DNA-binding CsgD family transcriptional regulator
MEGTVFMSLKLGLERQSLPVREVPVRFNGAQARALKTARIGLVLLNPSLKPIYCNSEALKILAYPGRPTKATSSEFSKSIRSIVGKNAGVDDFVRTFRLISGRRRYVGRIFMPEFDPKNRFESTIAITLERDRPLLRELVARFQLTDRESEAVQHLSQGLTSKEIAQRMNISVNTVKVFLRLVMIKMGVTTRSGVIGKLVQGIEDD